MKYEQLKLSQVSKSELYKLQEELDCGVGIAQLLIQRIRDCAAHPCELAVMADHLHGTKKISFLNAVQVELRNLIGESHRV